MGSVCSISRVLKGEEHHVKEPTPISGFRRSKNQRSDHFGGCFALDPNYKAFNGALHFLHQQCRASGCSAVQGSEG